MWVFWIVFAILPAGVIARKFRSLSTENDVLLKNFTLLKQSMDEMHAENRQDFLQKIEKAVERMRSVGYLFSATLSEEKMSFSDRTEIPYTKISISSDDKMKAIIVVKFFPSDNTACLMVEGVEVVSKSKIHQDLSLILSRLEEQIMIQSHNAVRASK
jgi:hypothetical protein